TISELSGHSEMVQRGQEYSGKKGPQGEINLDLMRGLSIPGP
ncbi:hypothetical protein HKBW3C_02171, partial [Candidatus Hakubella thermalkaliphila]